MARITIYHGSTNIIESPQYGLGKAYNDYGRGFYCTEHIELAKEWSCNEGVDGFVNKYELELAGLRVLDLTDKKYSILNWLAILMDNRIARLSTPIEKQGREYLLAHFLPDYKNYDVIIGYRADDSYFSFARAFVGNGISLKQLGRAMHLGKLGQQIVLMTEKAFNHLEFIGYEVASNNEYYPKRKSRDDEAREAYLKELEENDIEGIYMRDIIRDRMEDSNESLR